MKQVIKRIRTDGYIITQQDLEFIDREQDEWLQQWTPDPIFDKKVKDAREAYEGLRPRGTNGPVDDDDVNDDGCFDQLRRLNPQDIGPNRIADNTAPEAVIAGYSGITGCPVFATPPSMGTIRSTIDMSDNSQGISFRTEHMNHLTDGNVIWHEMSTVPGNNSAIKRLVMSNDRNFIDDDDVASTIALQHKRLNLGLSFEPPAHHRAAEDGE
ncbi:unnamed protein product [Fusarium graminearum]|nr:unnamed protein product [Fusarium graminearum]